MSPPRVLLHGFTGSPASWEEVRRHLGGAAPLLVPALLGHDGTAGPPSVRTFDDEVDRLATVVRDQGLADAHLAGYSLGARVGLGLLVRHPRLFRAATLIGVNPGLADATERQARAAADEDRARLLEREGLPTFVAAWEALRLFRSQEALDPAARDRQRRIRLGHDPAGLARSLRVLGLAAMPDLGPRLPEILTPVRLVVGEQDARFRRIAEGMVKALPRASLVIVSGAGHNVILERPAEVASLLEEPFP